MVCILSACRHNQKSTHDPNCRTAFKHFVNAHAAALLCSVQLGSIVDRYNSIYEAAIWKAASGIVIVQRSKVRNISAQNE